MRSWSWMSLVCCKCHFIIAGSSLPLWNSNAVLITLEGQEKEDDLGFAKTAPQESDLKGCRGVFCSV